MGVEYRVFLFPADRTSRPTRDELARLLGALVAEAWLPPATAPQYPTAGDVPLHDEGECSSPYAGSYVQGVESVIPFPLSSEALTQFIAVDSALLWTVADYDRTELRYPFTVRPEVFPFCTVSFLLPLDYSYDPRRTLFDDHVPRLSLVRRLIRTLRHEPEPEYLVRCGCGARLDYTLGHFSYFSQSRIRTSCPDCGRRVDPSPWRATIRDGYGSRHRVLGGLVYRFAVMLDCEKARPGEEGRFAVHPELQSLLESTLQQKLIVVEDYY